MLKFGVKIPRDSEVIIDQSFPGAAPQGGMGSPILNFQKICPSLVNSVHNFQMDIPVFFRFTDCFVGTFGGMFSFPQKEAHNSEYTPRTENIQESKNVQNPYLQLV